MPTGGNEQEAVRWLVDGMNVIGSRPDRWWRDRRGAMANLVKLLADYARESGDAVTVVFDGKPFELERSDADVEVVFASRRGRDAADYDIERRVASAGDRSGLRVVTSDRRLAEAVRAQGAEVVSAGSFRARLAE
jgi:predicted RNA-binding protein with PIN domain